MRNLKFFLTMIMASSVLVASAQFTSNRSSSSSRESGNNQGWNSFYIQYNPSQLNFDIKKVDDQNFTGLQVGYNRAFSISSSIPLFIEVGGALEYSFFTADDDDYYYDDYDSDAETSYNWLSIKIPANLVFNWNIPNSSVTIAPYVGFRLRGMIFGKGKFEDEKHDESEDWDLFDKDDMGKDAVWKRVQFGAQTGVNVKFNNKFFVGVGYGTDFTEVAKKTTISELSLTAGLIF